MIVEDLGQTGECVFNDQWLILVPETNVGKGAFNNHPTGKFYTTYICVLMG